ncbi:hypothetical protein VE01_06537 [Pseudogymnoascus verrucosus]|uniref:Karyogamy protein n=1 Tax=Pseudogymnoascus verrucosus TaxID=342668 RepID=A0A1B8GIQ8_9PEZI|nr:uncharacterized protein VE01_06537 [Pseudogymnoascus verrucosus]OBT95698.1 hypothetical protein VE01_06537 [Pseudogymnoascus verrucosus]
MTIGSVVLPLLRRHGSSSELKPTHATTVAAATSTSTSTTNLDSTTSTHERPPNPPPPIRQTRRPSPGLAARLKALGFTSDSKQRSPSSTDAPGSSSSDYIGRIPEDHIRSIDSLHRANSTSSLVPRRGRTWSSNSSSRQHAPQITGSAETGFTVLDPAADRRASDATQDLTPPAIIPAATVAAPIPPRAATALSVSEAAVRADEVARRDPSPVPKVEISDMSTYDAPFDSEDVQKYRLPEHVNGNGTKATLATKVAHLERMDDPPPPMPLPKDLPDLPAGEDDFSGDVQSYFNPFGLQRAGSIYTLSRVSFANQLAQLTSLQLPDAGSLASKVSAIPTSHAAARALMGAAEQIKSWISKASEVLDGLDADDDVEWAAAGGREGLEDVDNAIVRFEQLISVYVTAIEELQNRTDISNVPASELTMVVTQVETILSEWEKIRRTLTEVKGQVGVAIEWEELWNVVLGDIGYEMDILSTLVFEMEEKRHKSLLAEASEEGVDLKDLETIVEETPPTKVIHNKNRFSVAPAPFPLTPNSPSTPTTAQDDSSLLALFARMQPLRASLDFLPMRLSTFHSRAEDTFPTACDELEGRRDGLESSWAALEKDAASLRRELGEDRWVLVFRGAGRQANKMYESVGRSLSKLQEALDNGTQAQNASTLVQKIENYETKKTHYGPAIERVLGIIEKGVQDRLTVNGEIVRLHSEMQGKWEDLKSQMSELDKAVEAAQAGRREQQLRDYVSSLMSNDRSSTVGSAADTPGSSPASSVIMSNLAHGTDPTTPGKAGKPRAPTTGLPQPGSRHTPLSGNYPRRNLSAPRSSGYGKPTYTPTPASREASATPTGRIPRLSFSSASMAGRPRWNSSVKTEDGLTGHNFKPLSAGTPSPYARGSTPTGSRNASFAERAHERSGSASKIPLRRSMGGEESLGSPGPPPPAEGASPRLPQVTTPLPNRTKNLASFKDRMASPSPGPYAQQPMSSPGGLKASRRLSVQPSPGARSVSRRASMQPLSSEGGSERSTSTSPLAVAKRPGSSLAGTAGGRRTSLLPQPRGRETTGRDSRAGGRESPAVVGARVAMRREGSVVGSASGGDKDNKPKWRG